MCFLYPIFISLAAMCHFDWQYMYITIYLYTSLLLWNYISTTVRQMVIDICISMVPVFS